MSSIELTSSQKTILTALISLYRETEDAVKSEDITTEVDRSPGTIRKQMQSLKALQLIEGIPGPKGGYKPIANAYKTLDVEQMEDPMSVPLFSDGESVESANVEEIDLSSVHHPELCHAEIHLQGSVRDLYEGDEVTVGPTPLSKLVINRVVDGKDDTNNTLTLRIESMEAPAEQSKH